MKDQITDEELYRLVRRLERFADLTDAKYKIPGTNIRIGLDALIGLIPVVGEFIGVLMSLYIFNEARKIGVPLSIKLKMLFNIGTDFLIGLLPILGDVADIGFRANIRNIQLILHYVERERVRQKQLPAQKPSPVRLWLIGSVLLVLLASIAMLRLW